MLAICTKIKYPTQEAAAHSLRAIVARYAGRKPKVPVAVYICVVCHAWHLTSKMPSGATRKWIVAVQ
ncbi:MULTISPECIES: hypothetical protein [unclassified Cryobacterium]|uniref:hypothetical protein n=1 Tax=unclassified Cryobacterium TaxID=2649013 RepID=UPI002AB37366|nr:MULTISPECIES: hypothetical protein [unclassified Cryobacterium]MDY7541173.1 hypothetical protein [Cryobacterium sp. 5B3]MEA9998923.1 hypothetical protein [Cryobacterium sp. RTS3]MEB0267080.1 hypothetical protein [Cryobacterium sp. 10I5]MEB0274256.1 hypothetical protein [Cryobacterium sp. 5B3]